VSILHEIKLACKRVINKSKAFMSVSREAHTEGSKKKFKPSRHKKRVERG
jgi:hypothetical protein